MGMGSGKGKAPKIDKGLSKMVEESKKHARAAQTATKIPAGHGKDDPRLKKAETKPAGKGLAGLGKAMATKMAERKPAAPAPADSARKANADYKAQRDFTRAEAKAKVAETKAAAPKPAAAQPAADKKAKLKAVLNKNLPSRKPIAAAAGKTAPSGVTAPGMKKGGSCKKYARGGGIEVRGKTKGKFI
jgi:hypothetical protein